MNKMTIQLLLVFLFSGALSAQEVVEIDKARLLEITGNKNDTTYVVNFWATWCSPCVKEIGYFEDLHQLSQEKKQKVILVSLDFPNQIDRQVVPFLKRKEITAPVFLMTDQDHNSWINSVDPSWSGAIPATIIFNENRWIFLEQELSREELFEHVKQISR